MTGKTGSWVSKLGADDCLPKPFIPRELFARVEAILRRTMPEDAGSKQNDLRCIAVEDVMLEDHARVALLSGRKLELTTVEYDLLRTLLRSAGQVLSREEMVQMVLGRDFPPLDRSIDTHVSHLRKKWAPGPMDLSGSNACAAWGTSMLFRPDRRTAPHKRCPIEREWFGLDCNPRLAVLRVIHFNNEDLGIANRHMPLASECHDCAIDAKTGVGMDPCEPRQRKTASRFRLTD